MNLRRWVLMSMAASLGGSLFGQQTATYAERLGWKKTDRVLILHMDDAGMSHDSNAGITAVLEHGAARSLSVMMPCPWVPEVLHYLKAHPDTDAGLHLTLTSEWKEYRWGPLAGAVAVPGLVDEEGAMWSTVAAAAGHASADEVEREIRAQLERAERAGFHPTHLDSHMGTLFATPAFVERYVRVGIEKRIPVMFPGGHSTMLRADLDAQAVAAGRPRSADQMLGMMQKVGEQLWQAGLPVLDDLHNTSYDWPMPAGIADDDAKLREWRTGRYMETLQALKPGVTMVIMHCTEPSAGFARITDSGALRKADMLAMLDPKFQTWLKQQGFIVSTWRELMARRRGVK